MGKMIGDQSERMIQSPSSEGKMVIKLKIPKLEGERTPEKDVIGILPANEGKNVCLECGKEFSSGKALGGHMRVHVQSDNKNPNFLKPPKTTKFKKSVHQDLFNNGDGNLKPYYMNSVNDEGKPTCSQCGKTFPSMKSLFGHMRCHPERFWRGILPPPNTPTPAARRRMLVGNKPNPSGYGSGSGSSCSSEEESKIDGGDQVVDLTKFLRGWSVTERRGRRSLKPAEDDEGLMEAVEDLLSLANAGGSPAESVVTPRQLKVEENENSRLINLRMTEYIAGKGKAVMEEEIEVKPPAKLELDDGDMIDFFSDERCRKKMKKRKKMKVMMELQPPEQQRVVRDCKYKCTTCSKCFTTHQALGGHMSSHNKPKLASADRHPIEEDEVAFAGGFTVANGGGASYGNSSLHQCRMCDKVFATGQALGGHQRCHWTGQAPSSQITSSGAGGSSTGCERRVFDFDLNEVPLGMMEEDEGGNWYASSSYNSNIC